MHIQRFGTMAIAAMLAISGPAAAQFSDGFQFLKAVKERNGADAMKYLNKPGAPINAKDATTGETALHIITRLHDQTWLSVLLARGAEPDAKDRAGTTPLMIAAQTGDVPAAQLLLGSKANANAANGNGETPLILAVHNRDLPMIRLLLQNRANPATADTVGKSARDYAAEDRRGTAVLKVIEEEGKPAKPVQVMGPVR